jgi:hypothetical protein
MNRKRSFHVPWIVLLSFLVPSVSLAQDGTTQEGAAGGRRSRLTLHGTYTTDSYLQKNFYFGAGGDTTNGIAGDFDAYWTQSLRLYPRLILADNLNVTLSVTVAQGIWGLDNAPRSADGTGYSGLYDNKGTFAQLHFDWAYLAYYNAWSSTRWYIGRQAFGLGHLLVLDEDAMGIQIYRDFPEWGASLGFGFAKESEGTDGLTDTRGALRTGGAPAPDGRDADLFFLEWDRPGASLSFNPFFVYYLDRSNADGATYLPDGLGYRNARFRPQITRATVYGVSLSATRGALALEFEYDRLRGVDRIHNQDSGPMQLHDVNNGDLLGSNLYGKVTLGDDSFQVGGIFAQGSGDPDPRSGEGNINRIRTSGTFYITEVWEDSIMPDERGLNPDGLGSPLSRGYRELENTRIMQGFLAFRPRYNLRVFASGSLIRSSAELRSWSDANGDGVISPSEFGTNLTRDLGKEMDWRIDWEIEEKMTLTFRGGIFFPHDAAGYLINGNLRYLDAAQEMRLSLTVPIPEFSLGG